MDGPPPPEEDFSQLPLSDRLTHKNWKARVSAYEELVKLFSLSASDSDPVFDPYLRDPDVLKKCIADSNAVAQEKGIEVVSALVKYAGESAARVREGMGGAGVLVEKCLGSTRAGTKKAAVEVLLGFVEVENGAAGVLPDVVAGLSAKQPKVVAGSVTALKEIFRSFGPHAVPLPLLLKALPKIFAHTDKTVRAEGVILANTLYQAVGSPLLEPALNELKPVQAKELKEGWDKLEGGGTGKGTLKPERFTKKEAREREAREMAGAGGGGAEEEAVEDEPAELDPRAFAEEVDIVPRLPSGLHAALTSSKWKERKEALDELLALLKASIRIKDVPELGEVAKELAARVGGDANVNCVMVAAACLKSLAEGLLGAFGRYREAVVPPMLERLKERKASVTDAIGEALDAVFATTTLADILPDIQNTFTSKNPQIKEGSLKFLARCLSTTTVAPPPATIKPLSEGLATLLEDSVEGARNEAATCLGTLMKIVGERPLGALMGGIAEVRKVKVIEAKDKAVVKCKVGSAPPAKAAPPPAATKKAPPPRAKQEDEPPRAPLEELANDVALPKAKVPAKFLKKTAPAAQDDVGAGSSSPKPAAKPPVPKPAAPIKKAPPPAAAAAASKSKPAAGPGPGNAALESFKYKHSPEDAEALATDLIPTSIVADFSDANWKLRLAALEEMTSWVQGLVAELDAEVVVRFLIKKGGGEKNFQVSSKLYGILCILAEQCPSFGKSSVAIATPHLSEKLGDAKLKKPASDALMLFAEQTSLQFVLSHAYETFSKQKAPKVLADSTTWIETAVTEFGVSGLSLRTMIDFLKTGLGNSNAAVRTSATKALVTVKIFVGPSVKELLGEINPQLLNTITSEFDKAEGKPAPEPVRQSKDLENFAAAGSGGAASGGADPLDDLFPRVEVDALLKGTTILADAKSDAWKTKKEALETFQAILDQGANKRLKPTMGDITQILKARITDSNKVVQLLALDIVARIATGMGKPFEKYNKFFVLPTATVLADQKANIRAGGVQTLTAIATACEGVDTMVSGIATALETNNPTQRASLLSWVADWFKEHEPSNSLDLSIWAKPVITCLDDRSGDVRKGAQAVLPVLIAQAGFDYVMQQTNVLKPASRGAVVPMIKSAAPAAAQMEKKVAPAAAPTPAPATAKASVAPARTETPVTSSPPAPASPTRMASPAPSSSKISESKLTGVRRKLPQGTLPRPESRASVMSEDASAPGGSRLPGKTLGGLKRPASVLGKSKPGAAVPATTGASSTPAASSSSHPSLPFKGQNSEAKKLRLSRDAGRWVIESGPIRSDVIDALQSQMEPYVSSDLLSLLFSRHHNAVGDYINGLGMLCDFYADASSRSPAEFAAIGLANSDLALKYVSIRVHEPQPNLISRCLDVVESVTAFFRETSNQLTDNEAMCFVPTIIQKLGDARDAVRIRVHQILQSLPKVYAYSRIFQMLMDYGLKSKVAKTRQGTLDELGSILKRNGITACDPVKILPIIASSISDKDAQVRKAALTTLSEAYGLVGDQIWALVGKLSPKDRTQLEERLKRVNAPTVEQEQPQSPAATQVSRLAAAQTRAASPSPLSRIGGIPRPASPAVLGNGRGSSNLPQSGLRSPATSISHAHTSSNGAPVSGIPSARPKSMLPSRMAAPRPRSTFRPLAAQPGPSEPRPSARANGMSHVAEVFNEPELTLEPESEQEAENDNVSLTISKILSNDSGRSVDALKSIQKILEISPEQGPTNPKYRDLSDHTEGLVDTITLQMSHVFEHASTITEPENMRLAKHLIQTLNALCDHPLLVQSLPMEMLTALLEELTMRLLQTDEHTNGKVKDLSKFINMIILRFFATCRRMIVIRSLFQLLLQIVKPFPSNSTSPEAKEAKVAELVLKCIWKLARNIPSDLEKQELDPVELFPAIEHFLQSVPPNEWRARATNRVPSGDMPLRTIKIIVQHVVAHYGDDVYDFLSSAFDDPSATIVYPYVYRILNTSRTTTDTNSEATTEVNRRESQVSATSSSQRDSIPGGHRNASIISSSNGHNGYSPPVEEPDPDDQLISIINHISSETTGAMHKEGITELHHFLKAYPHKKPRVDRLLESTGPAFRKYIARALASRAAEDEERNIAVAGTLSRLESNKDSVPPSPATESRSSPGSAQRSSATSDATGADQERLNRLHDIFQYRSSTASAASSHGRENSSTASTVESHVF